MLNSFEESKHKRDSKGQFSETGSSGSSSQKKDLLKKMKEKHPFYSSDRKMTTTGKTVDKKTAKDTVKKMRADGVFASLFHIGGPASGPKSEYAIVYPESADKNKKENSLDVFHEEDLKRGLDRYGK